MVYTPAEVLAITSVRNSVEVLAKRAELRDVFLCHGWDDRQGAAKELHDLLDSWGVSAWFSEKDVGLGVPLLREIDKGLAKSRVGIALVTPSFLNRIRELSEAALGEPYVAGTRTLGFSFCHNFAMQQNQMLVSCNRMRSTELFEVFNQNRDHLQTCDFELRRRKTSRSGGTDPAVLVAIVSATSAGVSALIAGIFRIVESRYKQTAKIVVRGADGTTVEVPAGTSPERLQELVEVAKSLNKPELRIIV